MPTKESSSEPKTTSSPTARTRVVSLARTGRFVVIRQLTGLGIVDALGTAPRVSLPIEGVVDFVCVGPAVWVITESTLQRYSLEAGKRLEPTLQIDAAGGRLIRSQGAGGRTAVLVTPDRCVLLSDRESEVTVTPLTDDMSRGFVRPINGLRVLTVHDRLVRVRDVGRGDGNVARARLKRGDTILDGGTLFNGRALVVLTRDMTGDAFIVMRPNGSLIHEVSVPTVRLHAIAEGRGIGFVQSSPNKLVAIDLRYGRVLSVTDPPIDLAGIDIDEAAKYVVLAGFERGDDSLQVLYLSYTELFGGTAAAGGATYTQIAGEDQVGESPGSQDKPTERPRRVSRDDDADGTGPRSSTILPTTPQPTLTDAASGEGDEIPPVAEEDAEPEPAVIEVPDLPPLALGTPLEPRRATVPTGAQTYRSPIEHINDLLDLAAARAACAIADAWDSGRLSLPVHDALPFAREVSALVGRRASGAPEELALAEERLARLEATVGRRGQASFAAGVTLPFVAVVTEFGLSTVAAQILLLVVAPAMRGEIARLYGVLANDEQRPICDRHLVQTILARDNRATDLEIARELTGDAPLITHGLVNVAQAHDDQLLFAALAVDPVLIDRIVGNPEAGAGPGSLTEMRHSDRTLAQLVAPAAVKRDAVVGLAQPRYDGRPVRVVVRGRPGTGRRTFLAALAARLGRRLAVIDAERLPRSGKPLAQRLRLELRRAHLRGAVPCISGMSEFEADGEGVQHVREVLQSHPGPITFRVSPEFKPPLEPGYMSLTLPSLSETERLEYWQRSVETHGVAATGLEELAGRFRVGPGIIEAVVRSTSAERAADPEPPDDANEALDRVARQHINARLGSVATRVKRLARWEQVALPDDIIDSIREFVGRVNHRRTVYEHWGFDAKMTSSRGLTALFHGPPGTGKSMVAGLIARELKLDLYRVDLARITSKWIGETEKNLAQIFDAAEDGQVVILFDEADSLFAKRTEVKSSVDRYANLEVNYLLQRFDTFDGVAILTTNLAGSLDTAFKRRLSLRLAFPFPDEEMRVRLWAAHIPSEVPTVGDFDFEDLASRFPLSGGYIRNSALRAAFLAAQEQVPLSHEHLIRAVHLEYREMGKLSPSGRME